MKVCRFVFNMFGVNTYVVWDPESLEAAIIDPGMIEDGETAALKDFIEKRNLHPTQLLNTHSHLDHIFGNAIIKSTYGLEIKAHPGDKEFAENIADQARKFGGLYSVPSVGIDVNLSDGDVIFLGKERLIVIEVPGHSEGSVAFYCPESGFVITGDALFAGSIGRTDLPGGDYNKLISSIRSHLLTLPEATVILPGHGGESTIGYEKRSNPFVKEP